MEQAAGGEELSVESEFADTVRYIDLYLRQKTDLFLQHYLFEPVDFLSRKLMCLAVLVTLLVAGTLAVLAGVILLIATFIPLWASLLLTGAIIFGAGGLIFYGLFSKKIVLQTPGTKEMVEHGDS
jgi:hypothetical protein